LQLKASHGSTKITNRVNSDKTVEILLVEDNPGDARLAQEAIREARMRNRLNWVLDGVEALTFLRKEGKHKQAPRPDLILLDLNLPRKDGRELLAEIKGDEQLKRIPVVVLTTSEAEEDISRVYRLKANCYIAKPPQLDDLVKIVKSIEEFWFRVARLPAE
jgi:two-component system, chemotaxis family, response regulator Rcp1